MSELTTNGTKNRHAAPARRRTRHQMFLFLVFLGGLPLPIVAYALAAYVVTHGSGAEAHLLSSQLLLIVTALLVAGLGGFLIWSTTTSIARATEVETRLEDLDGALANRLERTGPVMNSVARMLTTIERQATELNHVAQRLDTANRELESANARLQEVSFTDEVTKLYNRRFFSIRLEEEVARHHRFGNPLSLVLLDLDSLKGVNDELGHLAGDETLRGVADVLVQTSRSIDVVCRYGGDEFAVLLVETPRAGARPYAERIRDALAAASFSHGRQVTASFGVASLSEWAATGDDLVRAADEALYAAKRAGKNGVVVWTDPGIAARADLEVPVS